MSAILGIDLGTTNTVAAIWENGEPRIIPNSEGYSITPSIVAFDQSEGGWVVGHRARALAERVPHSVVYSIKRFMGRRFGEDIVQDEIQKNHILYEMHESRRWQGGIEVTIGEKPLTPQEVSAKVLQKVKADAEAHLGQRITQAVITVPAYFHDSQRQATRDAGRIAGLEVKRVLNEPTAACLAFGHKKLADKRKTVAVYDLGGGTFDISILDVGQGPFRVRATNGDTHLGGDDLDWTIVEWMLEQVGGQGRGRQLEDFRIAAQLRAVAERAKVALSTVDEVRIHVPSAAGTDVPDQNRALTITRSILEKLAEPVISRTLDACARALQDARLPPSAVQEVLMVGGQTRMPAVRLAVQEFFGLEPNTNINPDEVVALGAAVQAAILTGEDTRLRLADVVPLTLGVNTRGLMDAIIPRNTAVPVVKTKAYSTAEDNQESVEIQIHQGERPLVKDNVKLGSFILKGIEPAPRGEPEIEVTFRVDQDGILHVTGKDTHTGNIKEITITDSVRLSDSEIQEMIHDAEEHATEYTELQRQFKAQAQCEDLAARLSDFIARGSTNVPEELMRDISTGLKAMPPGDWTVHLARLESLWSQSQRQLQAEKEG